jgi:hypothetical protein
MWFWFLKIWDPGSSLVLVLCKIMKPVPLPNPVPEIGLDSGLISANRN